MVDHSDCINSVVVVVEVVEVVVMVVVVDYQADYLQHSKILMNCRRNYLLADYSDLDCSNCYSVDNCILKEDLIHTMMQQLVDDAEYDVD